MADYIHEPCTIASHALFPWSVVKNLAFEFGVTAPLFSAGLIGVTETSSTGTKGD